MKNIFLLIITLFIVYMCLKMIFDRHNSDVDFVKSSYDNQEYLVRNMTDKTEAARLLSLIRERLVKLVDYLSTKYPNDERIHRLVERFDPNRLSENSANNSYTSYSVNKGEKIVFCLRQRDDKEQLLDLNTMIFVAIHELAHLMSQSIGHTKEFWENMRFLLQISLSDDLRIYQFQPYHITPQKYCGTIITDTPIRQ